MVLTIGSLFSGIGGIELGFERAGGYETIWFVERDKYAQAILDEETILIFRKKYLGEGK
jgi:site-specific DNA-cytosine methylase